MSIHMLRDIKNLHKNLFTLSSRVEDSLRKAMLAMEQRDGRLAQEVIDLDDLIDGQEVEIEENCLKILALYHPVAGDLRLIVGALKINNDLERIGDIAVNIAERAAFISTQPPAQLAFDFHRMAEKTRNMLKESLDAMVNEDPAMAYGVCAKDDEIDQMNRDVFDLAHTAMTNDTRNLPAYLAYLSVSRHLERIADMATSIAEDVIYMHTGEIIRHKKDYGNENGKRA